MRKLPAWLRDECGTSTTEYAIIMALIAAAIMLASDAVRLSADSSFRRTAVALGLEPAAAPVAVDLAATAEDPDVPPLVAIGVMPPVHAFAWGVLLAAAAIVAHSRYRKFRYRRAVRDLDCVPEKVDEEPKNPNFGKRQEIQRVLLRHFDDAIHSRIEVRHVMSHKTRTAELSTRTSDLRAIMESEGFHHLLVMRHGKLAGVISDRDLRSKTGRQAVHIMTANPLTVSPTTHISHAITLMLHRRISCLPVVAEGEVKGILTTTDMMMSLQCLLQLIERMDAHQESPALVG